MQKKKFTMASLLLAVFVLALTPLSAFAADKSQTVSQQHVNMKFDGQLLAMPSGQTAFIYQSRFYVPLRFSSYALLKNVDWNGTSKTVTVSEPSDSQLVILKEYVMNSVATEKADAGKPVVLGTMKVMPVSVKFVFNGVEKKLPAGQQAFNSNGTVYVPIRFISESAGAMITWDQKTDTVIGESKDGADSSTDAGSEENSSGGQQGGGSGTSTGGGNAVPQTKDEIAAQTEKSLEAMRDQCINSIVGLVGQYEGDELISKAQSQLTSCQSNFESVMTSTRSKLQAIGVSDTEIHNILQVYRDTYNAEIDKWKKMAEDYLGISL